LQYDQKWASDRGFVHYDFNNPANVPSELEHTFDVCVIDPPFITREVWEKYSQTAKLLLKEGIDEQTGIPRGRVICTTINENAPFMHELLGATPTVSQFSLLHLIVC
jgi:hypothetical protein